MNCSHAVGKLAFLCTIKSLEICRKWEVGVKFESHVCFPFGVNAPRACRSRYCLLQKPLCTFRMHHSLGPGPRVVSWQPGLRVEFLSAENHRGEWHSEDSLSKTCRLGTSLGSFKGCPFLVQTLEAHGLVLGLQVQILPWSTLDAGLHTLERWPEYGRLSIVFIPCNLFMCHGNQIPSNVFSSMLKTPLIRHKQQPQCSFKSRT